MKEKIIKIGNLINKFIQSDYYIVLIGLLVYLGWFFNVWVGMLLALLAISVIPLFFFKDTKHLLCFLMFFTLTVSENRHDLAAYKYYLIPFLLLLVAGFVVSLVRFKRDWTVLTPRKIKGFHLALLLWMIPFAFAGVGRPNDSTLAVIVIFLLIALVGFGYTFFVVTNTDESRKQIGVYVLKILVVMGLIVLAEMLTFYARNFSSIKDLFDNVANKNSFSLGWGGCNNVAPVLAMSIPACFYFCVKKNRFTPLLVVLAFVELLFIVLSGSRGTLLITILAMPCFLLYVARVTENKFTYPVTFIVIFVVTIALVGLYGQETLKILSKFLGKGFDSSSRIEYVYPQAIEAFKQWPIFGAGWDYKLGIRLQGATDPYTPFWYHCTVLQVIADMGTVGLIFYIIFFYWRYRTFAVTMNKPEGLMLFSAYFMFDFYGMLDTNFFGPTFFVMLMCICFASECTLEDHQARAFGSRHAKEFINWIDSKLQRFKPIVEPQDE